MLAIVTLYQPDGDTITSTWRHYHKPCFRSVLNGFFYYLHASLLLFIAIFLSTEFLLQFLHQFVKIRNINGGQ